MMFVFWSNHQVYGSFEAGIKHGRRPMELNRSGPGCSWVQLWATHAVAQCISTTLATSWHIQTQLFSSILNDAAQNQPNTLLCPTTDSNSWGNFIKDQVDLELGTLPCVHRYSPGNVFRFCSDKWCIRALFLNYNIKKSVSCGSVRWEYKLTIQTGEKAFLEQKENTVSSGFKKHLGLRHWRSLYAVQKSVLLCVSDTSLQPASVRQSPLQEDLVHLTGEKA